MTTDFPDLKVKALVSFPAAVYGGIGLAVRQDGGKFYFDLNYSELEVTVTVPPLAYSTAYLVLWEQSQNTFRRISLTTLKATLALMP